MKKISIVSFLLSGIITMTFAAAAHAAGEFFEDCETLAVQEYTENTANISLGGEWRTNSVMGGGSAPCGVVRDVNGADGKCFRLSAKGDAGNYAEYPGIIRDGNGQKNGENHEISFRLCLSSINAEAGVRFLKSDEGYYELVFPQKGSVLAVLNKVTENSRVCIKKINGIKQMKRNVWYNVRVTASARGELAWYVTDENGNSLEESPNGSAADTILFSAGKPSGIELIAGGYGSGYVYFDDISYRSEDYISRFYDDFENTEKVSYSAVFIDTVPEDETVVDSRNKPIGDRWVTNGVMGYDSRAYAGITDEDAGTTGKCLAISARAEWQKFGVYPGVILKTPSFPSTVGQNISFKFRAKDGLYGGGGAGIRFQKSGSSFYELVFPRLDSGYQVILNKVENGVRETVYSQAASPGCRSPKLWYRVNIVCCPDGRISWTVRRCDGVSADESSGMDGYWFDEEYIPRKDTAIELISGGHRCGVSYFDDVEIKCVEPDFELNKREIFTDDFENDGSAVRGSCAGINKNWRFWSARAGYDNFAQAGNDIYSSTGDMWGKYLAIEARAQDMAYADLPTVMYTGEYPKSRGYIIGTDIKTAAGGYGAGVRFMISDDEQSWYELYFPSSRYNSEFITAEISKISEGNRTRLYAAKGQSAADCIAGDVTYRLTLKVFGGKISYTLSSPDSTFSSSGGVTDCDNPMETGRIGFIASGGRDKYTGYDNFVISSYDMYIDDGAEPDNVIYKRVPQKSVSEDGIIDFGGKYTVRKICAQDGTAAKVSNDGVNFIPIGIVTGGKLLNTLTNLPYRYIKLSNVNNASVWTEMNRTERIRVNDRIEFSARINGADGSFEVQSGSDAAEVRSGFICAKKISDGNVCISVSDGVFGFDTFVRTVSPFEWEINEGIFNGGVRVDGEMPPMTAVIRYIGADKRVLKTAAADTVLKDGILSFTCEYCPYAEEISVIFREKDNLLSAPLGEYVISYASAR